jgi:hypothetical protein
MWTAYRGVVPAMLRQFGLGAEPVWSQNDNCWFALSGQTLMRYSPQAPAKPRGLGQIPGLFGLGADPSSDLLLVGAAQKIAEANPCASHAGNEVVRSFQVAWNASNDPMATPNLTEDGFYGKDTAAAADKAMGGGAPPPCPPGWFTGQGTVTPNDTPPSQPSSSNTTPTWVKPTLIGVGVAGVGLVGYALYRKHKKGRR